MFYSYEKLAEGPGVRLWKKIWEKFEEKNFEFFSAYKIFYSITYILKASEKVYFEGL